MKLLLCVYIDGYYQTPICRRKKIIDPDNLSFEDLKQFFAATIWPACSKRKDFVDKIQKRRNAVHAFRDRYIGDFDEFHDSVGEFLEFVGEIYTRLPWPD